MFAKSIELAQYKRFTAITGNVDNGARQQGYSQLPIIESIVAEHAEEAAFLWLLRDAAVAAPHYSLQDLAELDERVEAHIDGLRVAGDGGWAMVADGLQQPESGEVFAAAVLAFEGDDPQRLQQLYAAVETAPETVRGLVSAIGWVSPDKLRGKIAGLLGSDSPLWLRTGIAACAVHRVDCGEHLARAIEHEDLDLKARALRAAGEIARVDLLTAVRGQVNATDPACGFWAARSAVLLGDRAAGVAALKTLALTGGAFGTRALDILLRVLDPDTAAGWLKALSRDAGRRRELIIGCGVCADPAYVPWLIEQMADAPEDARIAGEAFSMITGADIASENLEGDWPSGYEAGPTEDAEDEEVAMDPDEDLPWPDPARIKAWWTDNQGRFKAGARYLTGQPISAAHCQHVLKTGMQRQRIAAALELALMQPDAPLFETRAPGRRQQAVLG